LRLSAAPRVIAPLVAVLAIASCGDSSDAEESEHENSTPAVAIQEIGETRAALATALATYEKGDRTKAEDQVAEAYVSHFEHVEGPLGKADDELNEKLEEAISQDLRDAMKAGKPGAAIEAQISAIVADLEKAEAALR
jgi:hypothetical protein